MTTSTWGVALDGAQARILRDLERDLPDGALPEEVTLDLRPQWPGGIPQGRPGSLPAAAAEAVTENGGEDGGDFCQEVLWLLGSHLRRGDFDRLIFAATPQVLAEVRALRGRDLAAATAAEAATDLLHLSPERLRDRLRDILITCPG